MIEYELVPRELRFRRGIPYRLHVVNAGKEGHDFTAPDFFISVQLKNTDALNESGASVFLQPGQTIDIYVRQRLARDASAESASVPSVRPAARTKLAKR